LVDRIFPVPRRFRSRLPAEVAELSRLLTSGRGERDGAYLGRPGLLSAYLHYFLPWNVYRLCRFFSAPGFPPLLADGDTAADLGSGPLTLPIALWIARPELRKLTLEFRCVDRTGAVLEAGKKIFEALTARGSAGSAASGVYNGGIPGGAYRNGWTVKTFRGAWDAPLRPGGVKLVTAVNLFNEVYPGGDPGEGAEGAAARLAALCGEAGSILVVEPGLPRSGAFIAALRSALLDRGRPPLAPCPHGGSCPLPGNPGRGRGRAKWCHFAFETACAPKDLHRLSAAAGIPKERATLSFLLAGPRTGNGAANAAAGKDRAGPSAAGGPGTSRRETLTVRIISDPFPLPSMPEQTLGRYGCSVRGLVLAAASPAALSSMAGSRGLHSGTLLELPLPAEERRDPKSGALLLPL
jgi:hypothetical protein